jgi:hypothetical protein
MDFLENIEIPPIVLNLLITAAPSVRNNLTEKSEIVQLTVSPPVCRF